MGDSKIIRCCCCNKQLVKNQQPSIEDKYRTISEGAKSNFGNTVFCGYCAKDLDENGLFPEESSEALEASKIKCNMNS